ncbi:MAG: hypothetical protein WEA54_04680 [Actinomycetota bacterium]
MLLFIVVLLLLAAIFGVLGTVLKVAFVLVLGAVLAVATIALLGYYWFRYRLREYQRRTQQVGPGGNPHVPPVTPSSTIDVGEPVRDELTDD